MSIRKRLGKGIILVVVALFCIAWFAAAAWVGMAKHDEWYSPNMVDTGMVPCATEDAPGPCYWNADIQGNGTGRSFTVDATGHVTYWEYVGEDDA